MYSAALANPPARTWRFTNSSNEWLKVTVTLAMGTSPRKCGLANEVSSEPAEIGIGPIVELRVRYKLTHPRGVSKRDVVFTWEQEFPTDISQGKPSMARLRRTHTCGE